MSPFFANSDEPGTMLVWTDADWSGNELTCKSTSAGAVQLEYYGIEAWSLIQQVCRSARTRMSPTRPRCRKRTAGRRWVIAGIKFAGVARIPRLVRRDTCCECNCLVTTGDVKSIALATSDFFPAKSTSVLFWSTQCELCKLCLTSVELNSCCSARRVLCESCPALQVLVVVPSFVVSSSQLRDCEFWS